MSKEITMDDIIKYSKKHKPYISKSKLTRVLGEDKANSFINLHCTNGSCPYVKSGHEKNLEELKMEIEPLLKHKAEEPIKKDAEVKIAELKPENEKIKKEQEAKIAKLTAENQKLKARENPSPSIIDLMKRAYYNDDYKLSDEELLRIYSQPKYKEVLKDYDINKFIDKMKSYSNIELLKKKNELANFAQIGAYNPELISKLDPKVQDEINEAIIEKQKINNAMKRMKYKLPINKPKATQAMISHHVNPMVFRGAFSGLLSKE